MRVDKSAVTAALRRQGDHDRALQAECLLSGHVDTERDANLLRRLDVDLHDLDGLQDLDEGPEQAPPT
jgi:hypothetical protein